MFNLQYISVRHLKDSIRVSKKLLPGNVHAPPLGLKVVSAKLAAQEHVAVVKVFGKLGRILRIARAYEDVADRSREEDLAYTPVRLARANSFATSTADQIVT
jgi:hypothetical protein